MTGSTEGVHENKIEKNKENWVRADNDLTDPLINPAHLHAQRPWQHDHDHTLTLVKLSWADL